MAVVLRFKSATLPTSLVGLAAVGHYRNHNAEGKVTLQSFEKMGGVEGNGVEEKQ